MKVFMFGGPLMGCNYVRLLLPMWANGWTGNYIDLKSGMATGEYVAKNMSEADIVVFHRPENHYFHEMAMGLKEAGKKIVFDNDDTFNLDHYHPFFSVSTRKFKRNLKIKNGLIYNFVHNADLVTTTTEFLANEYREHSDNVIVLPNYVNPLDWPEPKRNEGEKIRIGLVGSVSYAHDYEIIEKVIKRLGKRDDVTIVLIGQNVVGKKASRNIPKIERKILKKEIEFWGSIKNLEHIPWCDMSQYFYSLNDAKLDFMLIPRRENSFNKAKSNVKFLEAGMLEIPVIASTFTKKDGPYDTDIDGKNGILVKNTDKDWQAAIDKMIKDKKGRREMGKRAYDYVLKTSVSSKNSYLSN